MASSDVDQKYLGRIATAAKDRAPLISKALYQILGLSVVLARKLYRARKLRKLDTSRDTKSLQLYHQIIWLSREGLSILELGVLPYTQNGELGAECQVLSTKLRASFHHIFCLFHNNPPITTASAPNSKRSTAQTPLSPKHDNGQRRKRSGSGPSPPDKLGETARRSSRDARGKKGQLRDPIDSITSDASFLTNPYAGVQPGTTPPPGMTPSLPPGFAPIAPKPSAFLLPAIDFVPNTATYFRAASNVAILQLPGAHPLRLSVALEHAAFLWDCVHDHEGARSTARRAIRALKDGEEEGVTDEMYRDAADLVVVLGNMMRRKSWEGTPKPPNQISPSSGDRPAKIQPATTFPPTASPVGTSYAPVSSRRVKVYRDDEGRRVSAEPRSPVEERISSRERRRAARESSAGETETATATTPTRASTAKARSRTDTEPTSYTAQRIPPPQEEERAPTPPPKEREYQTPPRPPPKDFPVTTAAATAPLSAIGSPKYRGPLSARTPTKTTYTPTRLSLSPTHPPSSQRTPVRPTSASARLSYPRPMERSPKPIQPGRPERYLPASPRPSGSGDRLSTSETPPARRSADSHAGYATDEGYGTRASNES